MKKIISCLLSILIAVQCFCMVSFSAFAEESDEYSTCYTKFVLSDNSTEYVHSIIKDDCLMVDVQWLCDKLGLKYRKFNTLTGTSGAADNYFLQRTDLMSSAFFNNVFSVSKPDSDFSFVFQAGSKEAAALSGYLGSYSVNLGTKVTPVTDENGNASHYVPLFAFCEIFNVAYEICTEPKKNYIVLPEPNITAIDILHMQNKLSEYKMQNCLVDAINDDLLSFLGMALGESLSNTIDSIVSLKLANLVDPTKDNYDVLALQMCSSDTDEVDKIAAQNDRLDFFYSASTEVYGSLIEAAQEYSGNKQPLYEEIVKDEYRWSLSAWEKTKIKYDNVRNLGKVADISEAINKYIGLGAPMIFNGLSLIFETASAQEDYLKFMNAYFEYADETLSKEEKMGYNYIQDRMKIYESSLDNAWILLSDWDMLSNIATFAAEELTGLQLGKLGLASTAGKWGVNYITGGAFDFNDIYYNCMVNQEFQKSSQKVVTSYLNESDFDLDTYRALEWTRLKSYYVANENGLELYNQYYETSKFNADNNPTLNMLYDVGFGKKEKYSDAELEEFAKKVFEFAEELPEDEIYKKFGIEGIEIDYTGSIDLNGIIIPEAAFEDYNIMIGSKAILDYESKKINSDTEELAEYMAVLLYGIDGTTPEKVEDCQSIAAEKNKWVLENNCALYQAAECKVVDSEDHKPVKDAEVTFVSEEGNSIACTTNDDGIVLGLEETISNSFSDDINGSKNTQGILEENDLEKQDSAFSQYEPDVNLSTVELYLPLGSYSLNVKASGYKDYEHDSKIQVKINEKCVVGEIALEMMPIQSPVVTDIEVYKSYGKKYLEFEWNTVDGAEGYELSYDIIENTKTHESVHKESDQEKNNWKKGDTSLFMVEKFCVRAYKTVNGEKVYSEWSEAVSGSNELLEADPDKIYVAEEIEDGVTCEYELTINDAGTCFNIAAATSNGMKDECELPIDRLANNIYSYSNGSCFYRNSISGGRVNVTDGLSGTIEVNADGTLTWNKDGSIIILYEKTVTDVMLNDLAKMKMSEIIGLMGGEYSAESWLDGCWHIKNDEVFPNLSFCVEYENYSDPLYAEYGESALYKKLENDEISLDAIEVRRITSDSSNYMRYMITDKLEFDSDYVQCAEILGDFSCSIGTGGWDGGTAESEAYSFEDNGCDITLHFSDSSISNYIMNGIAASASVMRKCNPRIYTAVISPIKTADNQGIKENTIYYGGWIDGSGPAAPRYTQEFILNGNNVEITIAPLMGSIQTVTFEISEISGNTYYLKNGVFRWETESTDIGDGQITVNDGGSFDIIYSVSGNQSQDHFVLG